VPGAGDVLLVEVEDGPLGHGEASFTRVPEYARRSFRRSR
jgi:hypothetical protein